MLFDKRRIHNCILLKTLVDPFNNAAWHAKELYYPVAYLTGIDLADAKKGSIITIDMDGMCGAERALLLRCEVMDPRLVLCKPGIALVSKKIIMFKNDFYCEALACFKNFSHKICLNYTVVFVVFVLLGN